MKPDLKVFAMRSSSANKGSFLSSQGVEYTAAAMIGGLSIIVYLLFDAWGNDAVSVKSASESVIAPSDDKSDLSGLLHENDGATVEIPRPDPKAAGQ